MGKYLNYYVFKDYGLILIRLGGDLELNDYLEMKKAQLNDPDYDPDYDIIMDMTEMSSKFSQTSKNEMKQYVDIVKTFQITTRKRKVAFLTRTPDQVVSSYMYKSVDDRNNEFSIFSDIEAALKWLGNYGLDVSPAYK